jgi:hypothetical protein
MDANRGLNRVGRSTRMLTIVLWWKSWRSLVVITFHAWSLLSTAIQKLIRSSTRTSWRNCSVARLEGLSIFQLLFGRPSLNRRSDRRSTRLYAVIEQIDVDDHILLLHGDDLKLLFTYWMVYIMISDIKPFNLWKYPDNSNSLFRHKPTKKFFTSRSNPKIIFSNQSAANQMLQEVIYLIWASRSRLIAALALIAAGVVGV